MKRCGACGNPRKGRGRKIVGSVATATGSRSTRSLRAVIACKLCFAECVHILVAPALQLTKST